MTKNVIIAAVNKKYTVNSVAGGGALRMKYKPAKMIVNPQNPAYTPTIPLNW